MRRRIKIRLNGYPVSCEFDNICLNTQGFKRGQLFIALRFLVASISDCPPDKKTIPKEFPVVCVGEIMISLPGTAAGTVRRSAVTVAKAICSGVAF